MKMDMQYIDNWSPELDIKILLRTIPRVPTRGANLNRIKDLVAAGVEP